MKRWLVIILWSAAFAKAWTQHQDPSWSVRRAIINEQCMQNDSLCNVLHKLGVFEGHFRTFFMGTLNHRDFPDYYALAMGGGLAYFSPVIKNFQVGLSGFTIYNLSSSVLHPNPPFNNRYEIQLFDVTDPDNHGDLDRLEDLYLRYYLSQKNHSHIQIGKFHLQTPLVNLQDGRMRPNLQEGIWAEWNNWKKIKFKGGWIWRTSPRGTVRWYTISHSLGVYPGGRAVNGLPSDYAGRTPSDGIFIGSVSYLPSATLNIEWWNYYVDNLFNTSLFKTEWKRKSNSKEWFAGIQYVYQHSLMDSSLPAEQQYMPAGSRSQAISTRVGFTRLGNNEKWHLNYTRITSHGRFLFPREWGVEPFYTFMFRERIEGAGNVHAIMLQNIRHLDKSHQLTLHTQAGIFAMPPVENASLNKYNMPSFYHLNVRGRYRFTGFLHGLHADILYSYKGTLVKNLETTPANYHNKVDNHLLSVVLDYYF
ncbi:MAG: OprD family outer membrane porin [Cyclobacteriaceae bacterium]|nr:OprD family outer membrane porin [Cyclobacteriaceae bacterium]MCX7637381.1 OprD family outer membrane porin [Cyclobacteriaceae bacterium]MDW8330081.1 OprD family outer membrane porin [Cyclobacteriaceae bacterium]